MAAWMPSEPETLLKDYGIQPTFSTYTVCSKCNAVYKEPVLDVPNLCLSKTDDPSAHCLNPLLKAKNVPILRYSHRHLKEWLAGMLAQPDVEVELQKYMEYSVQDQMEDIWESPRWWNFADGFMKPGSDDPSELRLLFGLGSDGFNPYQNRQAKQVCADGFVVDSDTLKPASLETHLYSNLLSTFQSPSTPPISPREHLSCRCNPRSPACRPN